MASPRQGTALLLQEGAPPEVISPAQVQQADRTPAWFARGNAAQGLEFIVAVLLLAGCASMAPRYETPPLPVASYYPSKELQGGGRVVDIGWRDYFTDPLLRDLIEKAIVNNRDLRSALLRVEEARASFGIQRAQQFPTLTAETGTTRLQLPADLSLTGQPLSISEYQVGLGLATWEIDFWGRVRSLKDAALENYLASDSARRSVGIGLVAQVANTYIGLCELDERMTLARQTISSRVETFRIVSRRVDLGATSRLNLVQVETLLLQARAVGAQLEQLRAVQAHALALLVGVPVDVPFTKDCFGSRPALVELRSGLPADLLVQRPDIVGAEHLLKAAHADIGAARAAFFPRVALSGSLGTASAELDGLFAPGSRAWIFSPSISLPLFDTGRRRQNLNLAETRRNLAVANYERTIQSAFRDVSDALSTRRSLAEQLSIAQATLATQAERARLSQLRFDNGAAAFLEVLDAQRDLLLAGQQLVQMRRALWSSGIALYAALGGGSIESGASALADTRRAVRSLNTP